MNRRTLLASLAALTSAFALSACGNDKAPAAPESAVEAAQPQTSMIVFVDSKNCVISQGMLRDTEAFRASAASRNITFVDTSTVDGYNMLSRYSVDGQAITHVPAIVTLRGNQIVGGAFGAQTPDQLQHMLAAASTDRFVNNTSIPQAARITPPAN